jgi:hypothetical protein
MKRTTTTLLLVVSLVMVLMAPASASRSITDQTLLDAGWFCFYPEASVGQHCISNEADLGAFMVGEKPSLAVMVFSPNGETFYGTEILRVDRRPGHEGEVLAEHHWKGGTHP